MLKSVLSDTPTVLQILLCLGITVVMSTGFSFLFCWIKGRTGYSKDLPMTYVILPIVICALSLIISFAMTLYSDSTEVTRYGRVLIALLAAFVMVRFRSQLRTTEELTYIFFVTAIGLCNGLGYIYCSLLLYAIVVALMIVLGCVNFPFQSKRNLCVRIIVSEDLDYEVAFKEVFEHYATRYALNKIKSKNFGTMFMLQYNVTLKKDMQIKNLVDEIRVINGNLDIVVTHGTNVSGESE